MSDNEILTGQQSTWKLLKKLGEGDAGEVYLVSMQPAGQEAILKRPRMSSFTGEIYRQSAQIQSEAKIIQALGSIRGYNPRVRVSIPRILDQSLVGSEHHGRNFIIIEKAFGFDLGFLARVAQMGLNKFEEKSRDFSLEDRALIDSISKTRKIPDSLLIKVLYSLIHYLDDIHTTRFYENGIPKTGIIWNDIKPDHLFWNSQKSILTIIDWGNARFLEADMITSDRQLSWVDDFRQLIDELGRFLSVMAPDLKERLNWPNRFSGEKLQSKTIDAIKSRLEVVLNEETHGLELVAENGEIYSTKGIITEISLTDVQKIQSQILDFSEFQDFDRSLKYVISFATRLVQDNRLDDLQKLSSWANKLPGYETDYWKLIELLTQIFGRSEGRQHNLILEAIQKAISKEWENVLWVAAISIQDLPEPDWWHDLTTIVRSLLLGSEGTFVRPLVAVRRIYFTIQEIAHRLENDPSQVSDGEVQKEQLEQIHILLHQTKDEMITSWTSLDPGPPDSSLTYNFVEPILTQADEFIPEKHRSIKDILNQPKAQVKQVLGCWENKQFLDAAKGLRSLLVWDPDRRRVLNVERLILSSPDWLQNVYTGPQSDDIYLEWITSIEFSGIELRNLIGPANWLDSILENCKQLRKGVWPSDLVISRKETIEEMPWLAKFERTEKIASLIEYQTKSNDSQSTLLQVLKGILEDKIGRNSGMSLIKPLDTWRAEARGSSARVVSASLQFPDGSHLPAAVKIMRMDQVQYALPLFQEEVTILSLLNDLPGISRMIECGFIKLDENAQFPLSATVTSPPAEGRVIRIGIDSVEYFQEQIEQMIESDWTPYLAIEQQKQEDNLINYCDAGIMQGQYHPLITLLQMSIQICDIMQEAHNRNIVYRDHKILHYYWQASNNGVYIIDWNVARYHPEGLSKNEIEMDIVQFGARGLHHILTGRTAPGALPLGPTRPEEIEHAAHSYKTQWTFDDQRLSLELRSILERVLAGEYSIITDLGNDLKKSVIQLG